jgi:nucleotide-binding universal stress UspA family protein
MKAVLCALDFSEAPDNVVKVALDMAARKGESLVVLYAYRLLQPMNQDVGEYRKAMEKRAKSEFDGVVEKLKMKNDVPYEFRAEIGFLSERIADYMKKNSVDIIVMGQQLAHSINEHKGLTFDEFLGTANVPVLVVPTVHDRVESFG